MRALFLLLCVILGFTIAWAYDQARPSKRVVTVDHIIAITLAVRG